MGPVPILAAVVEGRSGRQGIGEIKGMLEVLLGLEMGVEPIAKGLNVM